MNIAGIKLELIDDWNILVTKLWSIRLGMLGLVFGLLQTVIDLSGNLPVLFGVIPNKTFMVLAGVCAVASLIARLMKQAGLVPPEVTDATQ